MFGGIYQIRNRRNGKRYLGSALNLSKRWSNHVTRLRKRHHNNPHLQAAWDKYGEEAFVFEVLEQDLEATVLIVREQHHLDHADWKKLYNIDRVAGSRLGHTHTEATKAKLRQSNIGKRASNETRRKMSTKQRGRVVTETMRRRASESNRTRPITTETRKKMSESAKKRRATPAARQHMSEAHRGKPHPHDGRSFRGRHHTSETRQKMAEVKHRKSKLTWAKVRRMRALYQQQQGESGLLTSLAQQFDISRRYVSYIVHNEQWVE